MSRRKRSSSLAINDSMPSASLTLRLLEALSHWVQVRVSSVPICDFCLPSHLLDFAPQSFLFSCHKRFDALRQPHIGRAHALLDQQQRFILVDLRVLRLAPARFRALDEPVAQARGAGLALAGELLLCGELPKLLRGRENGISISPQEAPVRHVLLSQPRLAGGWEACYSL
jgi:hypothetical protein